MGFDLGSFIATSHKLDTGDLDFDVFRTDPLDDDALRCLRAMHDVESHTVCYLRDLLVTRVHRDPELTAFLTMWNHEEFWHGEAIGRVLEAHDRPGGVRRVAEVRRRLPGRDHLRPALMQLTSALTPHLTAVHLTWGAVNEWTTQAAYARLVARAPHPVLSPLLRRIMKQEGRHIDVYATEARRRLADSRGARRLTRWALRTLWAPVGSGVLPTEEVTFLGEYLFGGDDGQAVVERIDRRVDRLPGLEGLSLLGGALAA